MKAIEQLREIKQICDYLNETNSSTDKVKKLSGLGQTNTLLGVLEYTYSPFIKFNVTSDAIRKFWKFHDGVLRMNEYQDLLTFLADLSTNKRTGHGKLECICSFLEVIEDEADNGKELTDIVLNIIDKNLKIRMDAKSINKALNRKLIPEFSVSLCNVYAERKKKVDFNVTRWFSSRKMDGCRCITIVDMDGNAECYSRQGKKFNTLSKIEEDFSRWELRGKVFDGEICIVDKNGDEDFKSIMKEITRKDHTIEHPLYQMFDVMTLEEFNNQETDRIFSDRYEELCFLMDRYHFEYAKVPDQILVRNEEAFEELRKMAADKGWEGLVIRKDDTIICKRSDSMLKVKDFCDTEYVVTGLEIGPFRVIKDGKEVEEEVVTNFHITHKGNDVSVGSGLSLEQRRYFKDHQMELIGKTVTVQYFEETTNAKGEYSLRFPTLKYIYENGRDV